MNKTVYLPFAGDIIHHGHINIIEGAAKIGNTIIIGLYTDEVIEKYKRVPIINYDNRKKILENIKNVSRVIKQPNFDYTDILKDIKPDYIIHGDDWKKGPQAKYRKELIQTMKEWKGKVIDFPYTKKISSTIIKSNILK